jgi:hypothetical protein
MGGYSFRNVDVSAGILNGHIVSGQSDDRPVLEVREVSGLKPWELAKLRTRRTVKAKRSSSRSEAARKAWATIRARKVKQK